MAKEIGPDSIMGLSRQAANTLLDLDGCGRMHDILRRADDIRKAHGDRPMILSADIERAATEIEAEGE